MNGWGRVVFQTTAERGGRYLRGWQPISFSRGLQPHVSEQARAAHLPRGEILLLLARRLGRDGVAGLVASGELEGDAERLAPGARARGERALTPVAAEG